MSRLNDLHVNEHRAEDMADHPMAWVIRNVSSDRRFKRKHPGDDLSLEVPSLPSHARPEEEATALGAAVVEEQGKQNPGS